MKRLHSFLLILAALFSISASACVATTTESEPKEDENTVSWTEAINGTCVTMTLTDDATLSNLPANPTIANTNYGTLTTLTSGIQAGTQNRFLIKIPTSGTIPGGATVISATLSLYKTSGSGAGTTVGAYANTPWTEGTVTWNSFGNNAGSTTVGSISASLPNNAYATMDVMTAVQNWVNGSANNGLAFSPQNSSTRFASAEAPAQFRPKADICYATCSDGFKNAAETDIDCGGGTCAPCNLDELCVVDADCTSPLLCKNGVCSVPTCDDQGLTCGDDQTPNTCIACAVEGACAGVYNACLSNTACITDYVGCRILCADQACDDLCRTQFPQGAATYDAIIECINVEQCPISCGG